MPESLTPDDPPVRFFNVLPNDGNGFLKKGEIHEYDLGVLSADEATHVVVEQRGIDLVAQVVDSNDQIVLTVDVPSGAYGFEHICFVPDGRGKFHLRLGAWSADGEGAYKTFLRPPRKTTEQDRACMEGTRIFLEAERRRNTAATETAETTALYERAIGLWRKAAEPYPLAISLKQAGSYFAWLGNLDDALRCYDEALLILHGQRAPRQLAAVLNLAGEASGLMGDPERARRLFEDSRSVSQEIGDLIGEVAAVSNLGLWETSGGDLYRGLDLLKAALAILRELDRPYEKATTLHVLATVATQAGLFDEAQDALSEALEIRLQDGRPAPLANVMLAIGWVEHLTGNGETAVGHFLQAIELYRKINDLLGEAAALDRLGSAYHLLDQLEDARLAFQTSLDIYRRSADRLHTAHTASNLGCLLGKMQEENRQNALDLLTKAKKTFAVHGDRSALAHVLFCHAQIERRAGNYLKALRQIEEATKIIDALRGTALSHGHNTPTLKLWQGYLELQIDLLMAVGQEARAFEISDLSRSLHLYEILLESRVNVRSEVPDELLEQEHVIQRRLNAVELRRQTLVARGIHQDKVAAIDKILRNLLTDLKELQAAIRLASPRFAELRQPSRIHLEEVQQLLEVDTTLLSYVLGEERSFLFLVSRDRLESYILPRRQEVNNLARRVYHGLRYSTQRRARAQLPVVTASLSTILLGKVYSKLRNRRLLVVGDSMLHYIPFAALPLPSHNSHHELLVEHHDIVHLPSAAVLTALRIRALERPRPPRKLAVLADAVYDPYDDRLPSVIRNTGTTQWQDLPYTEQEALSILALVPPEDRLGALGFDANVDLVRSGRLKSYQLLHFATHGLLHDEHPELSGIALSMFDRDGQPRDGHLRLHEIYALDLPADLVVLSGCQTALTNQDRGAGLTGLTHGFFYAGASRLLVSLWDVDDEATAELMERFYRGMLNDGLQPASALRSAQRWMRRQERWQAEYFWAGFILQGDWG